MSRIRANFLGGTIGADVSAVATTLTSSQLANFPVVTAPDYAVIVLDPDGVFGNPEIVYLTAHTSTSGSGTISRGKEGTSARQHLAVNSVGWRHAATAIDTNYPESVAINDPAVWIDVRAKGAKGDGVTDDAASFQNAINSVQATGGGVFVPVASVRWKIDTGLTVDVSSSGPLTIRGQGKYLSNIRYTGTGTALSPTGAGNLEVHLGGFAIQLSGNGAVGIDMAQFIASSVRSVRVASVGGTGQIGVQANITNVVWNSYFNILDDVTYDSLATGVQLQSSVVQYANRWTLLANQFLACGNCINLQAVQGINIVAPYFNEQTGTGIIFGPNCDRATVVAPRQETSAGGSMFFFNATSNRTQVLGWSSHAGTIGAVGGTRSLMIGEFGSVSCTSSTGIDIGLNHPVIATANLPAGSAEMDGHVVIEEAGGPRNLVLYYAGARYRCTGTFF